MSADISDQTQKDAARSMNPSLLRVFEDVERIYSYRSGTLQGACFPPSFQDGSELFLFSTHPLCDVNIDEDIVVLACRCSAMLTTSSSIYCHAAVSWHHITPASCHLRGHDDEFDVILKAVARLGPRVKATPAVSTHHPMSHES